MGQLLSDLRYAWRRLAGRPGFTLVAVATLALGIGALSAVFGVVNAALLRPLPYPAAERLVVVRETSADGSPSNTSYATVEDWRTHATAVERIAAFRTWKPTLAGDGEPERIAALRVSHDFFELLGSGPAVGRDFLAEEDRPDAWQVVVLSHDLWTRRFGADRGIVGRAITLNGEPFTVVGVMPPDFKPILSGHFYEEAKLWAPLGYDASLPSACRTCRHLKAVARLAPGASAEEAAAELSALTARFADAHPKAYPSTAVGVTRLDDELSRSRRPALHLLLAAAVCVLLIACANVAGLTLVEATRRHRELAIRASLGGGRLRLARQLVTEGLLLTLVGAGAGLLLATYGVDLLVWLSPPGLFEAHQVPSVDLRVVALVTALSAVIGAAFGLLPAWHARRLDLFEVLRDGGHTVAGAASGRLRGAFVVVQVAAALALLVGAGLLVKSLSRLLDVEPGFDPRGVLTMQVFLSGPRVETEADVVAFYDDVLARVEALPGVESAAVATQVPFDASYDSCGIFLADRPDPDPEDVPEAERFAVSHDYFRAMGVAVLRGRSFTRADRAEAEPVAIVGEALARELWPGEEPLGKRIRVAGESPENPFRTVVGVARDVRRNDLATEPPLQAYIPHAQFGGSFVHVVVRSPGSPEQLAGAVRRAVWSVDPTQSIADVATMEERVARSLVERRFVIGLLGLFAAVAVALAAVGLYGTISYAVAMRTREFGVRIAVGARPADVVGLVMRRGLALTAAGLAIGLGISLAGARLISGMLFGVTAADPAIFLAAPLALLAVAVLACYVPSRRAAGVDPVEALRGE